MQIFQCGFLIFLFAAADCFVVREALRDGRDNAVQHDAQDLRVEESVPGVGDAEPGVLQHAGSGVPQRAHEGLDHGRFGGDPEQVLRATLRAEHCEYDEFGMGRYICLKWSLHVGTYKSFGFFVYVKLLSDRDRFQPRRNFELAASNEGF